MTEEEWRASTDPRSLIDVLRGKPRNYRFFVGASARMSERKLRLLACACSRRFWDLLGDERSQRAVEIAEKYADGIVKVQALNTAQRQAQAAVGHMAKQRGPATFRIWGAARLAAQTVNRRASFDPQSVDGLRGAKNGRRKRSGKHAVTSSEISLGVPSAPLYSTSNGL